MEEQNEDLEDVDEQGAQDAYKAKRTHMKKMLLYSILLSSNIGGTGVITGTASNLVFVEQIKPYVVKLA